MTTTTLPAIAPSAATRERAQTLTERISGYVGAMKVDARTRYLSASADHADCARRMREWDEQERRSAVFGRIAG